MRFITEDELRDRYRVQPFTAYTPQEGTRLTPGARQFLMDRGLFPREGNPRAASGGPRRGGDAQGRAALKKFILMLEEEKALFLKEGLCLADADVRSAGRVQRMSMLLGRLKDGADIKEDLGFSECTGITEANFSELPDDCFPIGVAHISCPNGREIISLHLLRRRLRSLEYAIAELAAADSANAPLYERASVGLRQIINVLSRMICAAFGSKICQKC